MSVDLLYQWMQTLTAHLPCLSKPKQRMLANFSVGLALARTCQLRAVAEELAVLGKPDTVERRLQRFLSRGPLPLDQVQQAFAQWVISRLPAEAMVVLLVDETSLQEHLKVMAISVAYQGRALPVAWECYAPTAYPDAGQTALVLQLLDRIAPSLPPDRTVLVEADRGIGCTPELLRGIAQRGWFYLVRVQKQVRLILETGEEVVFGDQVARGQVWQAEVHAFKKGKWLSCRALAWWRSDADEPWLLVSNHPEVSAPLYGRRMWEELAFRDFKSGGWQWHRSRVWKADHAVRLWLVMTLAYAWMLSVGSWALAQSGLKREVCRGRARRQSVFQVGLRLWKRWVSLGRAVLLDLWFMLSPPEAAKSVVQ